MIYQNLKGKLRVNEMIKKEIRNIIKEELNLILEKFEAGIERSWSGKYREIFVNPNKKEIADIYDPDIPDWHKGDIRFIAILEEESIYVVAADVVHITMVDAIGLNRTNVAVDFWGIGEIQQRNIVVTGFADTYTVEAKNEMGKAILNGKFDWMEKYNFDLSEFKKQIKK